MLIIILTIGLHNNAKISLVNGPDGFFSLSVLLNVAYSLSDNQYTAQYTGSYLVIIEITVITISSKCVRDSSSLVAGPH